MKKKNGEKLIERMMNSKLLKAWCSTTRPYMRPFDKRSQRRRRKKIWEKWRTYRFLREHKALVQPSFRNGLVSIWPNNTVAVKLRPRLIFLLLLTWPWSATKTSNFSTVTVEKDLPSKKSARAESRFPPAISMYVAAVTISTPAMAAKVAACSSDILREQQVQALKKKEKLSTTHRNN